MNIFEPLVESIIDVIDVTYKLVFSSDKFSIEEYFKIVELKNKRGQYPSLIKSYEGTKGTIYLFSMPIGLNESDFKKHREGLRVQLREQIEIRLRNGYIELEVISKKLNDNIPYQLPRREKESIYIPLGQSMEGIVGIDLKENPHSFIVGTTGSGKSVCTKGILTSLVNTYRASEVELYLCDLKMVELALFRHLKHTKKFVYEVEETTEVIADLLEETKNRYNLFMDHGVTSIFEFNKLPEVKKLKYQVLYIEEIVILLEDKSKKAMKLLKQLIAISRASGCYVFLTTQRPSSDVIDNVVKANINNRIVYHVEDEKNSIIALDSPEAKDLRGKGHGILKVGPTKTEFQSYFISDNQVKEHIKKHIEVKQTDKELDYVKYSPENTTNKLMRATEKENKTIIDKKAKEDIKEPKNAIKGLEDLSFLDNL